MALGSSSLTLYETLKAFSVFAKQGQGIKPLVIDRVEDAQGQELISAISLDDFFKESIAEMEKFIFEQKSRWFKENTPEKEQSLFQKRWLPLLESSSAQLIPASNSYVLMNLLEAVVLKIQREQPEGLRF